MENMNKEISGFINLFKDILLEKCENIIGIYLFGSLAYVGFNEETSDIDLVIITKTLLNKAELENIRNIHKKLNEINIKWAKRLGVSYTPIDMLNEKIFQSYQNLITMRNFILKLLMETKG
jgi:predicted nucleotidyltransferase